MTELTSLVPHTFTSLIPLLIPRDNYNTNPNLVRWRAQLLKGLKGINNPILTQYANSVLELKYSNLLASSVGPSGLFNFIWTHMLPMGFDLLTTFKSTSGIYGFMTPAGK
jgi:hypothetical protein